MPAWEATPDPRDADLLGTLSASARDYQAHVESFAIHSALAAAWSAIQAANRYVDVQKPWDLAKNPELRPRLRTVLRNLLEVLRQVSVMIQPAMPTKAVEMRRQLGLPDDFSTLRFETELVPSHSPWTRIQPGPPLFPRLDLKA